MLTKIKIFFENLKKIKWWQWITTPFKFLWKWLVRLSLPAILIILLVVPLYISNLRTQREEASKNAFPPAEKIQFGKISKTIVATAKVEYDYRYNVRVFQDSVILDNLVQEGQKIENNQLLARLDFVNTRELTQTEIQTQLNTAKQNLINSQQNKKNAQNIDKTTQNQQSVGVKNTEEAIKELDDKIEREKQQNSSDIQELNLEIADLQAKYDKLKFEFDINNSVNQLEKEVDAKEAQITQLENVGGSKTQRIRADISQINLEISSLQAVLATGVCDPLNTNFNQNTCDDTNDDIDQKQDDLEKLKDDLDDARDDDQDKIDILENEIKDLESDIKNAKLNPVFNEDFYKFGQPISSTQALANASNELAKLDTKINQKEAERDQKEDNQAIEALEDQKGALIRGQEAEKAGNQVQDSNLKANISQTDQQIASTQTQIKNLNLLLAETEKDIDDQQQKKELRSRLGGIVSKVNFKEGLEIPALQNQFEIVSTTKVLRLLVNADNRNKLKENLIVRLIDDGGDKTTKETLDKFDLKISEIGVSPVNSTISGVDPEYQVDVNLPIGTEVVSAGQSLDVEIILEEKNNVFYVSKTAISGVVDSKVYVGLNPTTKNGKTFFEKIEPKSVKIGIDTGRFVEILEGVSDTDQIFPIYAQTQEDLNKLKNQYLVNSDAFRNA
jgi:multidrug efflux pump subunit AcrA (membrane-fusion protein)